MPGGTPPSQRVFLRTHHALLSENIHTSTYLSVIDCSAKMRLLCLGVLFLYLLSEAQGWVVYPCRYNALGMESGAIKDNQLRASSSQSSSTLPKFARLHKPGGWSAGSAARGQFIEVWFGGVYILTGIKTQGKSDQQQWVTSYYIFYQLMTSAVWHRYKGLFQGNTNNHAVVSHLFQNPYLLASHMRIYVMTWQTWPSLRFEVMGCPVSPLVHLFCTRNGMRLRVPKNLLPGNVPANKLHLMLPSCRGYEHTINNVVYYEWYTGLNSCNTTCYTTPNYIHYYNLVSNDHTMGPSQTIWKTGRVRIPFFCSYRSFKTMTAIGLHPNLNVTQLGEHGFGHFQCFMYFYRTNSYRVMYRTVGNPIVISLNYRIYVQLRLVAGDPKLVIKSYKCWVTPTSSPNSNPRYYLIRDGKKVDSSVIFWTGPKLKYRQRWSFLTFVLLKNHWYIFLHCEVRICKGYTGFCSPRPGKRGLEDSAAKKSNDFVTMMSRGPINLKQAGEHEQALPKGPLVHEHPKEQDAPKEGPAINDEQEDIDAVKRDGVGPDPLKFKFWEST